MQEGKFAETSTPIANFTLKKDKDINVLFNINNKYFALNINVHEFISQMFVTIKAITSKCLFLELAVC